MGGLWSVLSNSNTPVQAPAYGRLPLGELLLPLVVLLLS